MKSSEIIKTMDNYLISVIIPVYNVQKYVRHCIDSVLNQTYKNTEIIIVNDGSTDRSKEIIDEYTTKENVYIINKENSGQSDCRKIAYGKTRGEYVYFMDADDTLEPDALETMLMTIIQYNADYCCCRYRLVNESNDLVCESPKFKQTQIKDNSRIIYEAFCSREIKTTLWTKLFKKDFLQENGLEPVAEIKLHDDCVLTNLSSIYANNVCFTDKILYNVLQRDGSISRNCKPLMVTVYDDIYRMLQNTLIKENKFIGNVKAFYSGYCKCVIYNLMLLANRASNYQEYKGVYNIYSSQSEYYHSSELMKMIKETNFMLSILLRLSYCPSLFYILSKSLKKRINH